MAVTPSLIGIRTSFIIGSAPAPPIVLIVTAILVAAFIRTAVKPRQADP